MEKLSDTQKSYLNKPIGKWVGGRPKKFKERTKEEILRKIEWAERESDGEKNIRVDKRGIREGCGNLFDTGWKAGKVTMDRCIMCV